LCAQITGAGRDAAEVNSRRRAIKQREKSGLGGISYGPRLCA
jgi:hypothetical protein